jgi:uncharacterized GH25 family protein
MRNFLYKHNQQEQNEYLLSELREGRHSEYNDFKFYITTDVQGVVTSLPVCQNAWRIAYGFSTDRVCKLKKMVQQGVLRVISGRDQRT